uniref:Putative thap domain protein n=1 Tax=Xenopsylla cheopis TaxID=163159 RepID=A0A6M2DLB3_XENCH
MGGSKCKVFSCKNNQQKTRGDPLEHISYHRFPKDPKLKQEWIKRVCKNININDKTVYYVCSDHFSSEDYEKDLKSELLKMPSRPKLKHNAVPSLRLGDNEAEESSVKECLNCSNLQDKIDALLRENDDLKKQLAGACNRTIDVPVKRKRGFIVWNPESPSTVSRVVQKWKEQQGTLK